MGFLLWVLAVILAVVGIMQLFEEHQIILGIALMLLSAAVGPGASFFRRRFP
ncbi:MAG: GPGG-motif small membrane protein [Actinomycetota bacterium]|nr:GPGG-motif small membrane protein [Actinomycetota bacterium]